MLHFGLNIKLNIVSFIRMLIIVHCRNVCGYAEVFLKSVFIIALITPKNTLGNLRVGYGCKVYRFSELLRAQDSTIPVNATNSFNSI